MKRAVKVAVERDGRNYKVMATNAAGERFCLTSTSDPSWADTYIEHVRHFFGVDVQRVNDRFTLTTVRLSCGCDAVVKRWEAEQSYRSGAAVSCPKHGSVNVPLRPEGTQP